MAQCKLCLQERELRNSHIIPEFMYTPIYDKEPKRYYEIIGGDEDLTSKIQQKGVREYLLCDECEGKFSKNERYADENLNGKNKKATARLVNQSMSENRRVFLYEFENYEYKPMRLFLDSLLWRLIISKSFDTPNYTPEILEKLRMSLWSETPLSEDDIPCAINSIMTGPGAILGGFILSPLEKTSVKGGSILSILIDGLEFNYYVTAPPPQDQILTYLRENGEMKIMGRLLYDMPDLIDLVKGRMDHLLDRLNKNTK